MSQRPTSMQRFGTPCRKHLRGGAARRCGSDGLAEPAGRRSEVALENPTERRVGLVADGGGDFGNGSVAAVEEVDRELHANLGQVGHHRLTEQLAEASGEGGT